MMDTSGDKQETSISKLQAGYNISNIDRLYNLVAAQFVSSLSKLMDSRKINIAIIPINKCVWTIEYATVITTMMGT